MLMIDFLKEEYGGVLSTEMVVFVAVICVLLIVAVSGLYTAMGNYFAKWAGFFAGTGN